MSLVDRLTKEEKTGLYIGGEWRSASDGRTITVVDPATEEAIAECASASPEDGVAAVTAAADAAAEWAATSPRQRSEILRRAFDMMIDRAEDYAQLITLENGKTLADSRGEVRYGAEFLRWFSEEAVRNVGDVYRAPAGDKNIVVLHQPVGPSLLVTPWNFPLSMGTRKIGPALAAGCTTILKPASDTPLIALALADLLEEAGVPPGVVNVVPADRSSAVVNAMLAHPRLRKLSFTGSTEVGRILLAEASKQVLNTSMELGGNAPFLILADADLDAAVEGAMLAKMRNAGEACTAANRFYVAASIADDFADRFAAAMDALQLGPGIDEASDVGPLINRATQQKVSDLVDGAVDQDAAVVTGGGTPDGKGFFYQPTVLKNVVRNAHILTQEIFGPVAPIVPFDDLEDAITMANDTEYGLISYVYTGDAGTGLHVAEALEAGMVAVNRGLVSDPAAPFGGVKQSGLGREGAHHGLLEYVEAKYVGVDW
ncbi:MAG TPA: NAD-dependent succinate-semialdehyde dehydrogenase [Acidimicrobiia bacterium]|jgi:succinate-semialdehyde dehydrogenase/glutarate-semialdehyde dehydrogenase|nr:NAD-dependent succinate-semialdehyde dehydrogenase [Acidimicrobiia bacterium]